MGAVRSHGVFDVLPWRNDLDRRQRADHGRAAGGRRNGAGSRRSCTRTSRGSRGRRPRRRLPDAVVRRRARPPAARRTGGGRAAGAAVQVGRRDRRRGEKIRRRASRRRVDRRRLLREQPGSWRPVRRALARRRRSRPAGRAARLGLPHRVVQQRCAGAGRDHRRHARPAARRDSAPRRRLGAGHIAGVGRGRPRAQSRARPRPEGADRRPRHGRRLLPGPRRDLGAGRLGRARRRRHLHRRRPSGCVAACGSTSALYADPRHFAAQLDAVRRRASPCPGRGLAAADREHRQVLRRRGHRERDRSTAGAVLRLAAQPRHAGVGQPCRRGTRRRRTRVSDPHPRDRRCGRAPGAGRHRACRRHQRAARPAAGDRPRATGRRRRHRPLRRARRDRQHATAVGAAGSVDGRVDGAAARRRTRREAVPDAQPRRVGSEAGVRLGLAGVLGRAVGRDRGRGVPADRRAGPEGGWTPREILGNRAGASRLHRGRRASGLRGREMGQQSRPARAPTWCGWTKDPRATPPLDTTGHPRARHLPSRKTRSTRPGDERDLPCRQHRRIHLLPPHPRRCTAKASCVGRSACPHSCCSEWSTWCRSRCSPPTASSPS